MKVASIEAQGSSWYTKDKLIYRTENGETASLLSIG